MVRRALPLLFLVLAPPPVASGSINATTYASLRSLVTRTFSLAPSYGLVCNACDAGHVLGAIVRLAFHDAAGVAGATGVAGGNGCLDYSTRENNDLQPTQAALDAALLASPQRGLISRADFYVLAATLVIELASTMAASPTAELFTGAGSHRLDANVTPLVLPFVTGRVDETSCVGDEGALPATGYGWAEIVEVFTGRFGYTPSEIVAIMGAHSLGRITTPVHGNISMVSWVQSSTSFSNNYFSVLYNGAEVWSALKNVSGTLTPSGGGGSDGWVMQQPVVGSSRGENTTLIMLRTDVELGVNSSSFFGGGAAGPERPNPCGAFGVGMLPAAATAGGSSSAQNASCPRRSSNIATIDLFAHNTTAWYANFSTAWRKLTRYGYAASALCGVDDVSAACVSNATAPPNNVTTLTASPSSPASPSATPPASSLTATSTATPTATPTASQSGTASVGSSPSGTPSAFPTPSRSSTPRSTPSDTKSCTPSPTASVTLAAASVNGSFSLSALPATAYGANDLLTTAAFESILSALQSAVNSSAGCAACVVRIRAVTSASTGRSVYAALRRLSSAARLLGDGNALLVAYTVTGTNSTAVASVSSAAAAAALSNAITNGISTFFPGVVAMVIIEAPAAAAPEPAAQWWMQRWFWGLAAGGGALVLFNTARLASTYCCCAKRAPKTTTTAVAAVVNHPRASGVTATMYTNPVSARHLRPYELKQKA